MKVDEKDLYNLNKLEEELKTKDDALKTSNDLVELLKTQLDEIEKSLPKEITTEEKRMEFMLSILNSKEQLENLEKESTVRLHESILELTKAEEELHGLENIESTMKKGGLFLSLLRKVGVVDLCLTTASGVDPLHAASHRP